MWGPQAHANWFLPELGRSKTAYALPGPDVRKTSRPDVVGTILDREANLEFGERPWTFEGLRYPRVKIKNRGSRGLNVTGLLFLAVFAKLLILRDNLTRGLPRARTSFL